MVSTPCSGLGLGTMCASAADTLLVLDLSGFAALTEALGDEPATDLPAERVEAVQGCGAFTRTAAVEREPIIETTSAQNLGRAGRAGFLRCAAGAGFDY